MRAQYVIALLALLLNCLASSAAQQSGMDDMPGMQHDHNQATQADTQKHGMQSATFADTTLQHSSSGTSVEPNSTSAPMLMTMKGGWMLMFHANAFVVEGQESSPRGGGKVFSTNWFMPMAQRTAGRNTITLRAMLSLEPATITGRQYPLLFQQGETAFGRPIADGQHPHNFFMELAALYDLRLTEKTLLSLYLAPVGDPALGPLAYPHRASAAENPVATLGHHQQDSTHIADDVATVGLTHGILRVEASGFHGREPDEHRWQIQQGSVDSWAARLTLQPGQNWSGQYSYGRIHSPEALHAAEDQERMTASVMYNRPLHSVDWTSLALWGRTRSLPNAAGSDHVFNSYLFESTVRFRRSNYAWTRIEYAERSSELLLGENTPPRGFEETPAGHVQAFSFGYARDFNVVPRLNSALGAQVTVYSVGGALQPVYGSDPVGVVVFLRVRLSPASR